MMNLNTLLNMKNQNEEATAYYEGRRVTIEKVYSDSGLVDVVDLDTGNTITLHSSKLSEDDVPNYYFL